RLETQDSKSKTLHAQGQNKTAARLLSPRFLFGRSLGSRAHMWNERVLLPPPKLRAGPCITGACDCACTLLPVVTIVGRTLLITGWNCGPLLFTGPVLISLL